MTELRKKVVRWLPLTKKEEIKSVQEKESINQALREVNKQAKGRAKEIRVVKEVKIDLKINEETDLDRVEEVSRTVVANKTCFEAAQQQMRSVLSMAPPIVPSPWSALARALLTPAEPRN